jgi:hypothetical protein
MGLFEISGFAMKTNPEIYSPTLLVFPSRETKVGMVAELRRSNESPGPIFWRVILWQL